MRTQDLISKINKFYNKGEKQSSIKSSEEIIKSTKYIKPKISTKNSFKGFFSK